MHRLHRDPKSYSGALEDPKRDLYQKPQKVIMALGLKPGEVIDALIFMGDALECQLLVGGQRLRTKLHPSSGIQRGQTVSLHLPAGRCRALRRS